MGLGRMQWIKIDYQGNIKKVKMLEFPTNHIIVINDWAFLSTHYKNELINKLELAVLQVLSFICEWSENFELLVSGL